MRKPQSLFTLLSFLGLAFLFATVVPVSAATAWSANGSVLYYSNGTVSINSPTANWGMFGITTTSKQDFMDLKSSTDGSVYRFKNADDGTKLEFDVVDGTNGAMHWGVMSFIRNGDIYMGNNADTTNLSVNGTIKSKELIVTNQGWADYVFEPQYNLMPLDQVSAYIDANKHLPDVPSASDIESQGLSVGDMQKIQMQKIEELNLYVIQLQKEIAELKK